MFAYSWTETCDDDLDLVPAGRWEGAACHEPSGSLTALFFSDEIPDIDLAKAICATCPLRAPCLAGAQSRREPAGVWGGQLFVDGRIVLEKRKRGRPPKVARRAEPFVAAVA